MDRVRIQVAGLQKEADERLASTQRARATDDLLRAASVTGLLLSFVGLSFVAVQRRREHRASQALLEGVLENAPIGLGFLDRSLRIRHINGALAKMSERALGATPGMSIWEVVPQLRATLEAKLGQVVEGWQIPGQRRRRRWPATCARTRPGTSRRASTPLRRADGGGSGRRRRHGESPTSRHASAPNVRPGRGRSASAP